jgi:hypothetical protein
MDMKAHLLRQMAFSRGAFGPGERRQSIIEHIRKELVEIEESDGSHEEWVDVVILALDGLWRSIDKLSEYIDPEDGLDGLPMSEIIAELTVIAIFCYRDPGETRHQRASRVARLAHYSRRPADRACP